MSFPSVGSRIPAGPSFFRELLGGLLDTGVHLVHRKGHLIGGVVLATGGQATERVAFVELRCLRLRPAGLDLLEDRLQPLRLLRNRLLVTLDELRQHVLAHDLDGFHRVFVAARVEQQDQFVDAALLIAT